MMSRYLTVSIELLNGAYHGRGDGGEPEWPPSPLRVLQSLVAAAAALSRGESSGRLTDDQIRWLERQRAPLIVAPRARRGSLFRLYVPDNVADKVAAAWSRGSDDSIAEYRTEKDVRPMWLPDRERVHYLWELSGDVTADVTMIGDRLQSVARSMSHLGWGVDMVAADARLLSREDAAALTGERWLPTDAPSAVRLRVPTNGTLDDLQRRHQRFLSRIQRDERGNEFFNPVPPLSAFEIVSYRRDTTIVPPPYALFRLQPLGDDRSFSYPQAKLIHIAGMVRHLAIKTLRRSPPSGTDDRWLETYVAGHAHSEGPEHRQLSYLPLPSIGFTHTNPSIRRVLIAAPPGDEVWLQHLARRLSSQVLQPTPQTKLKSPPALDRIQPDSVARCYLGPATEWHSVTPVILPGHDDHNPAKTRRLIEKALRQAGIEQPCEFDWSPFSRFPKSLSAHKYDRNGKPTGYIRPDHLLTQTAVHLTLRFNDDLAVPGPLAIGAGRHCGFGLMAPPLK